MTKREMHDTFLGADSILQPPFVKILKTNLEVADSSVFGAENGKRMVKNNQIKSIPAHELEEDIEQTNVDQMQKMSTQSLPDEKNSGVNVISSEAGKTEDANLDIIIKEYPSTISLSPQLGAPISRSRQKLLVLDLNGLLADIVFPSPKDYTADTYISGRAIFVRPFCLDFLKFLFERFEVAVWSSRTKKNVERVVDFLFGDMKHQLLFCWDQSHCTATTFNTLDNKHKALVFKELRKIWGINDPNLPWKKGDYDESNTLLLDDSPYKALLNPPHTAIFPYSYKFEDTSDNSLGAGGELRVYLEKLAEAESVQKFVQKHPLGQSAITSGHESWEFYRQAMEALYISPITI